MIAIILVILALVAEGLWIYYGSQDEKGKSD